MNFMSENIKAIGNLNGRWAFLLKFFLVSYHVLVVLLIGWGVWVTDELYQNREFRDSGAGYNLMKEVQAIKIIVTRNETRNESRWAEYDRLTGR